MFYCTFVYRLNDGKGREILWSDVKNLSITQPPWIILGDFNALMKLDERVGNPVREKEIEDMQTCMQDCRLMELKSSGQYYTWSDKQECVNKVFCILDKAVGNYAWFNEWPTTKVLVISEGEYDHFPLVINAFPDESRNKLFRFFNMWC